MTNKFKSHPWHGIEIGEDAPQVVTAFIEIVPTDTVKYEIDKETGYLKIDRPQKFSNVVPALYGFLPQTYCDEKIAAFASKQSGRKVEKGDGDPLDILVLSEHAIPHGDVILQAIPIGGLRLIDKGEADDKIIAVMKADAVYSDWKDLSDIPESILNRLKHYFLTYKDLPGTPSTCEIADVYGKEEALEVISISREDYANAFKKK
ncbi:MAG: Inorganic diphosphatase [Bacteroidota bacterium]|jgi:inorganic pyrophosphatase|nr:Inorganic diphosphatase [Bacteroidota bacterium]